MLNVSQIASSRAMQDERKASAAGFLEAAVVLARGYRSADSI